MSKRNCGIDLLKIISMFGIVFLHVIVKGGVLDFGDTSLSINSYYWIFECLFMCSVDCFGLVSGYLSTSNELNIAKLIKMWFQVIFYSLVVDEILSLLGLIDSISLIEFVKDITPIISNLYWYFDAYVPLCLIKGYIKDGLDALSIKQGKELFILLVILYCFIGLLYDPFSISYGYTSLWIVLLFVFGYLAKKLDVFSNAKSSRLLLIFFLCLLINILCNMFITGVVLNYNSPTVLLSALCLLIIFARLKINSKIISKISSLTFGVYLFHENENISKLLISDKLLPMLSLNPFIVILFVFLYSLIIFIVGLLIEFIRKIIYKLIKIDDLSSYIAEIINDIINALKHILFN